MKARDNIEKWTTKHDYNWYEIRGGVSPSKQEKIEKVSDGGTLTLYIYIKLLIISEYNAIRDKNG